VNADLGARRYLLGLGLGLAVEEPDVPPPEAAILASASIAR
jgi:hypothetical protein